MMDLSKLSPLPWDYDPEDGSIEYVLSLVPHGNVNIITARGELWNHADGEFISLARNAFDVMIRRGWFPEPAAGKWCIDTGDGDYFAYGNENALPAEWPDPFTALVEADRWYTENVDAKEKP